MTHTLNSTTWWVDDLDQNAHTEHEEINSVCTVSVTNFKVIHSYYTLLIPFFPSPTSILFKASLPHPKITIELACYSLTCYAKPPDYTYNIIYTHAQSRMTSVQSKCLPFAHQPATTLYCVGDCPTSRGYTWTRYTITIALKWYIHVK